MRMELKGLIAAVVAGLGVVGATFGVSAVISGNGKSASSQTMGSSMRADKQPMGASVKNSDQLAQGHAFFTQSCASCHGPNGEGAFGPNLHHEDMDDAKIAQVIKNGVKPRMPGFASTYNDAQVQALVAYVRSLK